MSNQIIPFIFESKTVRLITNFLDPLFIAKDVATALGYSNQADAIKKHCKRAKYLKDWGIAFRDQQNQQLIGIHSESVLIPESDVYRLVMRSKLDSAERFQDWVCEEVLPSIRKTGSYSYQPNATFTSTIYEYAANITSTFVYAAEAFGFIGNQATLSANRAIQNFTGVNLLEAMGHTHLEAPDQEVLLIVSDIALRLHCNKRDVNPLLISAGLQKPYRDHKNRLYYELTTLGHRFGLYMDTGKRHSDGTPVRQIKWRATVIEFLHTEPLKK